MRVAFRGTLYSRAWQQRWSSDLNPIKRVLIAAGLRGGGVETGEAPDSRLGVDVCEQLFADFAAEQPNASDSNS
jgi:hypothetical protein